MARWFGKKSAGALGAVLGGIGGAITGGIAGALALAYFGYRIGKKKNNAGAGIAVGMGFQTVGILILALVAGPWALPVIAGCAIAGGLIGAGQGAKAGYKFGYDSVSAPTVNYAEIAALEEKEAKAKKRQEVTNSNKLITGKLPENKAKKSRKKQKKSADSVLAADIQTQPLPSEHSSLLPTPEKRPSTREEAQEKIAAQFERLAKFENFATLLPECQLITVNPAFSSQSVTTSSHSARPTKPPEYLEMRFTTAVKAESLDKKPNVAASGNVSTPEQKASSAVLDVKDPNAATEIIRANRHGVMSVKSQREPEAGKPNDTFVIALKGYQKIHGKAPEKISAPNPKVQAQWLEALKIVYPSLDHDKRVESRAPKQPESKISLQRSPSSP